MVPGQTLSQGHAITSCNGQYALTMQGDGNLVESSGSQVLWATGTTNGAVLRMQGDGNLVEANASNTVAVWASGGYMPGSYLRVQDDGNIVVNSMDGATLWSSRGFLASGAELLRGGSVRSYDGRFTLQMQGDGNLVLLQGTQAIWASHTTTGVVARMQGDGNLVVADAGNHAVFASGTSFNTGAWLSVGSNGNLVIYSKNGVQVWSSNTCCH